MPKKKKVEIDINLAPRDPFFASVVGKGMKWALSAGRYIVIFTELVVILSFVSRFSLDRQLTDLNDSINQKQVIIESYGELEDNFRTLQGKLENYEQIEQQTNLIDVFPHLDEVIPRNIRLEEMVLRPDSVILSGKAFSQSSLNTFITNLQLSPNFLKITVDSLESESEKNQAIVFSIKIDTQEKPTIKKATKKTSTKTSSVKVE